MNGNKEPIFKESINNIHMSVWKNETQNKAFYNTTINRGYKDNEGKWQKAYAFNQDDLQKVKELLQKAEDYIKSQK